MKKIIIIMTSTLFMGGCASDGVNRLGYDILSNYQCSSADECWSPGITRGQYQVQCMGGTALPNCGMAPPPYYDEYVEERDKALDNIRDNK